VATPFRQQTPSGRTDDHRATSLLSESNPQHLTALQDIYADQYLGYERDKIVKRGAAAFEHNHRNAPPAQVLLMRHVLVHGDKRLIASLLSSCQ
jgi:hypothetical protein